MEEDEREDSLGLRSNVKRRSMKGKMATIRMKLGNIVEKGEGHDPPSSDSKHYRRSAKATDLPDTRIQLLLLSSVQ